MAESLLTNRFLSLLDGPVGTMVVKFMEPASFVRVTIASGRASNLEAGGRLVALSDLTDEVHLIKSRIPKRMVGKIQNIGEDYSHLPSIDRPMIRCSKITKKKTSLT